MKFVILWILFLAPVFSLALPVQMFWIPEAFVMDVGQCRMDMQNQYAWEKRESGNFYDYGVGGSCGFYSGDFWGTDVSAEIGVDWREAHDRVLASTLDAFLTHVQFTVFDLDKVGWGLGLGIHSLGFSPKVNDYNVSYFILQHQAQTWRMGLGAYAGNGQMLVDQYGFANNSGALIGVWRQTEHALFSVEWQSGLNRFGYLFFGGGVILSNNTRMSLGYGISNNRETQRDWVLMKVSLDFSWLSKLKTEIPFE